MLKINGFASKPVSLAKMAIIIPLLLAACVPVAMGQQSAAPAPTGAAGSAANPAGTPQAGTPQAGTPQAGTPQAGTPQAGTPDAVPVTGGADIQVADNPKLGKILVDSRGMTLYFLAIDTPTESKCVANDCVSFWPPLTATGALQAGEGITGKLTTITRPDGSQQVVYAGHPLYTFSGDQKPGDAAGHGLNVNGGEWYALTPEGEEAGSDSSVVQPASAPQHPGY